MFFWLIAILFLILALLLLVALVFMVVASLKGAPFVPMGQALVEQVVELAEIKTGDRAIDLGSGDGRLVAAMARHGAQAEGYEIQLFLVWWSRWRLYRQGLRNALVQQQNLWQVDCTGARVVTLYAFPSMMDGLERKLQKELAPGARVVSLGFVFPNWQPSVIKGKVRVYVR
jgi:hypothetical protein